LIRIVISTLHLPLFKVVVTAAAQAWKASAALPSEAVLDEGQSLPDGQALWVAFGVTLR
jgi:hypothetical protein